MAAQWPQQSPPSQGYAYPIYQQQQQSYQPGPSQYPPQIYGSQAIPAQPYNYAQQGSYQQPHPYQQHYSQAPSQALTQAHQPYVAPPTPPVCYNCGSPEHWAQSCPEQRREMPAGEMSRPNYGPSKRPKYTAPVITKYPVPPQAQTHYGPQGYGGQPYGQPAYPQYQPQYGPPTPMATYSPQHQQWPPNSAQPQYIPSYPQGTVHQQQPYPVPPSPAATSYGPHYQGSMTPQGPPHHPDYFIPSHSYPPARELRAPSHSSASATTAGPAPVSYSPEQQFSRNKTETGSSRHESSASMQSQVSSPGQNSAPMSVDEDDEDDLGMLDIPDVPKYPGPKGEKSPKPVGYALPADYEIFESVGGELPAPALEANGCIQSVFVTQDSLDKMLLRFTDCGAWEFSEEDPIFLSFNHNSDIVPFEGCSENRVSRLSEDIHSDAYQEDGELSPEDQTKKDKILEDTSYKENQNGSATREVSTVHYKSTAIPHKLTRSNQTSHSSDDHVPAAARDTEEILAALGVTGAPKPVRAPARPYPPPESSRKAQKAMSDPEQRSLEKCDPIKRQNLEGIDASNDETPKTPIITLHDPFDPEDRDPAEQSLLLQDTTSNSLWSKSTQEQAHQGSVGFPPPPPPPMRKSSHFDESPISPGLNQVNRNGYAMNGSDHTNGISNGSIKYMANGKPYSPIKLRSERVYDRKRHFESRDSSDDEKGNERRRQADDVTPKLKRRQPKVAAAYDRRW